MGGELLGVPRDSPSLLLAFPHPSLCQGFVVVFSGSQQPLSGFILTSLLGVNCCRWSCIILLMANRKAEPRCGPRAGIPFRSEQASEVHKTLVQ